MNQSHFKFTLNQTGDTSRVLGRGFLGANSSKVTPRGFPHPVEITNCKYIARALLSQYSNRDTRRLFYVPYPTISYNHLVRVVAMPRGQQKHKATGTSTTGQPPVRRRATAATATYARTTTTRAEAEHGEREEPLASAGRARWL